MSGCGAAGPDTRGKMTKWKTRLARRRHSSSDAATISVRTHFYTTWRDVTNHLGRRTDAVLPLVETVSGDSMRDSGQDLTPPFTIAARSVAATLSCPLDCSLKNREGGRRGAWPYRSTSYRGAVSVVRTAAAVV